MRMAAREGGVAACRRRREPAAVLLAGDDYSAWNTRKRTLLTRLAAPDDGAPDGRPRAASARARAVRASSLCALVFGVPQAHAAWPIASGRSAAARRARARRRRAGARHRRPRDRRRPPRDRCRRRLRRRGRARSTRSRPRRPRATPTTRPIARAALRAELALCARVAARAKNRCDARARAVLSLATRSGRFAHARRSIRYPPGSTAAGRASARRARARARGRGGGRRGRRRRPSASCGGRARGCARTSRSTALRTTRRGARPRGRRALRSAAARGRRGTVGALVAAEATAGHDALWCGLRALCAARLAACQDAGACAIAAVARRELRFACTALSAAEQLADRRVADAQRRCAFGTRPGRNALSLTRALRALRRQGRRRGRERRAAAAVLRGGAPQRTRGQRRRRARLWDLAARGAFTRVMIKTPPPPHRVARWCAGALNCAHGKSSQKIMQTPGSASARFVRDAYALSSASAVASHALMPMNHNVEGQRRLNPAARLVSQSAARAGTPRP